MHQNFSFYNIPPSLFLSLYSLYICICICIYLYHISLVVSHTSLYFSIFISVYIHIYYLLLSLYYIILYHHATYIRHIAYTKTTYLNSSYIPHSNNKLYSICFFSLFLFFVFKCIFFFSFQHLPLFTIISSISSSLFFCNNREINKKACPPSFNYEKKVNRYTGLYIYRIFLFID